MTQGEKGQITVEAVLILGFFLLIFIGVTFPMAFTARNTATDTTVLADAKFATEQIGGAAGSVVVNGSKRTLEVYVPGYNSPSKSISTTICSDGDYINTTVAINTESYNLSSKLYGGGWILNSDSCVTETNGSRYDVVVTYKNINITSS
jgi:uncharacterized protein (UPF0333 family)